MKKKTWLFLSIILTLSVTMAAGLQACGSGDKNSTFYGAGS